MTTRRMATLLVALFLLTSAATAYAECAWVLWTSRLKGSETRWETLEAFRVKEECDKRAVSLVNDFNPRHPNAAVDTRCLPDTIDPRGPKVK